LPATDEERLRHMLEAARKAEQLVAGITLKELEGDEIRGLALTHLIEILGEAASMTATRNRLIHGYFIIDLEILWKIATEDLQPVIAALRGVVEQQD
jgi:uncharacterized protein with HEPN domain